MISERKMAAVGALAMAFVLLPLMARSAGAALVVTSASPLAPAVGYASTDGSFIAVWAEDRGTGTGMDLYAARLNAAGIVAGSAVPVLVAPGNQSDPALAFSEHNRAFLVVYTDDGSGRAPLPTPGVPIPGNTPGLPTPGATAPVPPPPPLPLVMQSDPAPADALVPAEQGFQTAPELDIVSDGTLIGPVGAAFGAALGAVEPAQPRPPTVFPPTPGPPPTGVPPLPTPTSAAPLPPATPDPGGPPAPPTTSGSRDLHGTWIGVTGLRLTTTFTVVGSPADDTYPSLGYVRWSTGEQFALVWREVTGSDAAISVMRLDGRGFFFIPSAKYNVAAGSDVSRPSVAGEANAREWFAVWSQTSRTDPSRDLYGRKLNSNAVPSGPTRIVASGPSDQAYPSVGSLGAAGGYILAWENRMPGEAPDIRVRRLNRNGVPYALETDFAGGAPFSFAPNIASSNYYSTLVVWLDRNAAGDNSILAAQVNRDGRRLGPERLVVQGGAGPSGATPVVPPPVFPSPPVPPPVPPVPPPGPTAPVPPALPTP